MLEKRKLKLNRAWVFVAAICAATLIGYSVAVSGGTLVYIWPALVLLGFVVFLVGRLRK